MTGWRHHHYHFVVAVVFLVIMFIIIFVMVEEGGGDIEVNPTDRISEHRPNGALAVEKERIDGPTRQAIGPGQRAHQLPGI